MGTTITRVTPNKITFLYLGGEYTITGEASFVHHDDSSDWLAYLSSARLTDLTKRPEKLTIGNSLEIQRQLKLEMAKRGMTLAFEP